MEVEKSLNVLKETIKLIEEKKDNLIQYIWKVKTKMWPNL